MKGKLICYNLEKISPSARTQIKRDLFGYIDFSNKGKYKYRRKGILNEIPHIKPIRSVIIVNTKDESKITKILKEHGAKYHVSFLNLNQTDSKILKRS